MTLSVVRLVSGPLKENCFVLGNEKGEALIIDPGAEARAVLEILESNQWTGLAVINTHGHFDHIGGVSEVAARLGCPFYLHGADSDLLRRANLYAFTIGGYRGIQVPEEFVDIAKAPNPIVLGDFEIDWMHLPGHTPGSVCFRIGDCLFSGDTILPSGMVPDDLPGSNREQLDKSLRELGRLPQDLRLHPGHGRPIRLDEGLRKAQTPAEPERL